MSDEYLPTSDNPTPNTPEESQPVAAPQSLPAASGNAITTISEIPCPCLKPDKEHLIESVGRYGCMKCNFWIKDTVAGYKLTPQDVYDLLHGDRLDKVTDDTGAPMVDAQGQPVMARWTDFHEFTSKAGKKYQASLAFHSNWKLAFRFPERAPIENTGRLCPECQQANRAGQLVIKENKKGEKFIACNAYPACKYTEAYSPFMVKTIA